tara:strand:- start:1435 stop:1797 length:363 start_codon:yes stop_codon:yes gene_type:complete
MFIGYINFILSSLYSKNYEIDETLIYCDSNSIIDIINCTNICKFSLTDLKNSCDKCFSKEIEISITQIYINDLKEISQHSFNYSLNECSNINEEYNDLAPLVRFLLIFLSCFGYFLCKDY